MALIIRHTAVWTGVPGLPGYSQFYQLNTGSLSSDAQAGHDAVAAFFDAIVTLIPSDIDVTVDPIYQALADTTGDITTEDTVATPAAATNGGYVSLYAAQVGVLVEWTTATFIDGRRLRGRTYLVPLGNSQDSNGTLPTGTVNTVQGAADTLAADAAGFAVWHRPKGAEAGSASPMSGALVRDKAAILRSRMP